MTPTLSWGSLIGGSGPPLDLGPAPAAGWISRSLVWLSGPRETGPAHWRCASVQFCSLVASCVCVGVFGGGSDCDSDSDSGEDSDSDSAEDSDSGEYSDRWRG